MFFCLRIDECNKENSFFFVFSGFVICVSFISRFDRHFGLFARIIQCSQLLLPIHGSRRCDICIASYSYLFRREKRREKNAHSSTSQTDHKVFSVEMHVKRFKRASEVSSALSFPSYPMTKFRFHCSFPVPALESIFLTTNGSCAGSHELPSSDAFCRALKRATNGTLHCLPTLQQATPPPSLFSAGSAKESSLKCPPLAFCRAVNRTDNDASLPSFIETSAA